MLYEIFYYMVFTRHSAGKIWSSICLQDIAQPGLHYQMNLIRLTWVVLYIRFVWQINLMKIIIYMIRTQRRIKNPVKHKDGTFCEYSYRRKAVNYFCQKPHLRSLTGVLKMLLQYLKVQGKVNTYAKMKKSKYCKKGVKSHKSMWKMVWLNNWNYFKVAAKCSEK